jgi:hypothetical protein
MAGQLGVKTAFNRACSKLPDSRIIRQIYSSDKEIFYQFTTEENTGSEILYSKEADVTLDKETGRVSINSDKDLTRVVAELNVNTEKYLGTYLGHDMTVCIDRIFKTQGDLFPIKPRTSFYFVPIHHEALMKRVKTFVESIEGKWIGLPVPNGSEGFGTVCEAVEQGLLDVIKEYEEAVLEFNPDTKGFVMERMIEKIKLAKFKTESYGMFLGSNEKELQNRIKVVQEILEKKVELILDEPAITGVS